MKANAIQVLVMLGSAVAAVCLTAHAEHASSEQRTFPSASEATNALVRAAGSYDKTAMREIFGPDVTNLLTGDKTLDQKHFDSFVQMVKERCQAIHEGNKIFLSIGHQEWQFPIPLVESNRVWRFDTAAGEEEIINRHIGRDEYYAIGVCHAFVKAEQEYYGQFGRYAQKIDSAPGKTDGLYWPEKAGAAPSPLWAVVAEACDYGYRSRRAERLEPFHGYIFKILAGQGPDAPGGAKKYVHHGKMTDGFALLAYPVKFGESGIMTFIVNQDGIVLQRCLGKGTATLAAAITEYNPDKQWARVREPGLDLSLR